MAIIMGYYYRHVSNFELLDSLYDILNLNEDQEMEVLKPLKKKSEVPNTKQY